jgi:hypothetical protein
MFHNINSGSKTYHNHPIAWFCFIECLSRLLHVYSLTGLLRVECPIDINMSIFIHTYYIVVYCLWLCIVLHGSNGMRITLEVAGYVTLDTAMYYYTQTALTAGLQPCTSYLVQTNPAILYSLNLWNTMYSHKIPCVAICWSVKAFIFLLYFSYELADSY